MRYIAALLILLCGCTTPINNIENIIPIHQRNRPQHKTINIVLKHYLTNQAYELVKDIPAVDGVTFGGSYVPGVNFWSSFLSVISGSGFGRKVVFSRKGLENDGIGTVLHEYFHHIDDLCRDTGINLVSIDEFKIMWKRYKKESPRSTAYIQGFADKTVTNLFGIGEWSEQMAYTLEHMILYGGPPYVKHVYRKIMKGW